MVNHLAKERVKEQPSRGLWKQLWEMLQQKAKR
jgi:hypothetical protein